MRKRLDTHPNNLKDDTVKFAIDVPSACEALIYRKPA